MASASYTKPNTTFKVVIQPPDFGSDFSKLGNIAKKPNGIANADEKPSIPIIGLSGIPPGNIIESFPVKACTSIVPRNGPVHENDTITKVAAIKNIPTDRKSVV